MSHNIYGVNLLSLLDTTLLHSNETNILNCFHGVYSKPQISGKYIEPNLPKFQLTNTKLL